MKVVILAGGLGTRITEEAQFKPKPMVEIGGMPILWHIMKGYAHYGYNEFVICGGYKQHIIKQWFADYFLNSSDVRFNYTEGRENIQILNTSAEPWDVTISDTGYSTMTGGRVKRIREYIGNEPFMMTYGDGVCDVDINRLVDFHRSHGKIATLTAIMQDQSKGVLDIGEYGAVRNFREKKNSDGIPINAGFMVLQPEIFDYIEDDSTVLEDGPLERLSAENQLMSYIHKGFWQCMDSLRERQILEDLWAKGTAPWKVW